MTHLFVGSVSVQQPIFMGGKIVAANDIARLAETLARTRYDQQCQEVMVNVDQAYWQVVSLAGKKRLAESYADLLHKMERDVDVSVREGVATEADALQVKVKANEADMLLTKAGNGLALSKMLLCKVVGLPLDSDIVLADESASEIPLPRIGGDKSMEDIYADRPETRSLELAGRIYDDKVKVARADALPQVAGIAAYSMVNPNLSNGFDKSFAGYFNAGVMVKIPIFHGGEHYYKIQKAKAEASLYKSRLEDAKELVNLQVTQIRKQEAEALEKLTMARSNLEAAEENLRTADIGYKEGVINANTALGAHTAWLQAQSEYIDAGIELQMLAANLNKAEGNYGSNGQGAVQDAMNE
jgi:outer membrane protein TolC